MKDVATIFFFITLSLSAQAQGNSLVFDSAIIESRAIADTINLAKSKETFVPTRKPKNKAVRLVIILMTLMLTSVISAGFCYGFIYQNHDYL